MMCSLRCQSTPVTLGIAFLLTIWLSAAQGAELELNEVLNAYESFAKSRQAVALTLTLERKSFNRDAPTGELWTEAWNWARRGKEERLRYDAGFPLDETGRPTGLYDYYRVGSETRLLRNWDPQHPQKITPANQGTVQAAVYPRTGEYLGRALTHQLLWSFSDSLSAEEWSLRDIAAHAKSVEFSKTSGGIQIALGKFDLPGMHADDSLSITLDSQYRCTQVIQVSGGREIPLDAGSSVANRVTIMRTVKKFFDAPHEMVPEEVTSEITVEPTDGRHTNVTGVISNLRTNEEVTDEDFNFTFPEHAQVTFDPPLNPQYRRVVLWGPDGKPAKEILSMADIPPDPPELQPVEAVPVDQSWYGYLLFINAVVIGVIVMVYFRKKRNA